MERKKYLSISVLTCSLLLVLFFFGGCASKDLSEGNAATQIKEILKNDSYNLSVTIGDGYFTPMVGAGNFASPEKHAPLHSEYLAMEKQGFITLKYEEGPAKTRPGYERMYEDYRTLFRHVNMTDKGKKFLIKEEVRNSQGGPLKEYRVVTAFYKFVKITGITEPSDAMGAKMCMVNYETKYEFTPFGEIFPPGADKNKTYKHTTEFVLYKDGWKLLN